MFGIPADFAAALWCAFLWAILSTALILWIINFRNIPKGRLILPLLLISGWLFRPAFSNYLLGQYALFSVLMALGAWLALKQDRPILAGILAALSLIKPTLTIIPLGLLFIQYHKKLKGILSVTASSLLLVLPPTILLGWWPPEFLADISKYALENRVSWSIADIGSISGLLWLLMAFALIGLGIYKKDILLSLGAAFVLNAAFVPHTADYDLVSLIPLIVYIGHRWLFAEKKRSLLFAQYISLIWFPWISLIIAIMWIDTNAVELWYRFIWLTYRIKG